MASSSGRRRLLAVLVAVAALVIGAGFVAWWMWRPAAFHEPRDVAALAREIERVVPGSLRAHHVPGASVAVVQGGTVRWTASYGLADAAARRPMTPQTVMQIASVSKTVAAYAVVRLALRGRVALDAPVDRFTGGWRLPRSEFDGRGVTLRRLMSHTAGINVDGYPGLPLERALPSTEGSLAGVSRAGRVRIAEAPGGGFRYSGGGYTIAQLALEQTTGEPFSAVVAHEVLRPLDMNRTGFACTTSASPSARAARGHDRAGEPLPAYRFREQAAAGVCSTATDMGRFAAALLDGPVAAAMSEPAPHTDGRFGLGVHVEQLRDGTRRLWHDGANRGWRARLEAFPDRDWALVVLTNGDNGDDVIEDVTRLLVR